MKRDEAFALLSELTHSDSLLKHARAVEVVMRAYADDLGEDVELWGMTGLLHDADYEAYPDQHPNIIVERLRDLGEHTMAHAISAHYTLWNVPYETALDKALIACDELTGFIMACAKVRPDGIATLTPKSVKKKLKDKAFAAKVDRDEIRKAMDLFAVDPTAHILRIISALAPFADDLGIAGRGVAAAATA